MEHQFILNLKFFIVPCAVGTFYDKNTRSCIPCPLGMYQSEVGQMHCYACPSIAGKPGVTVSPGARVVEDCKGKKGFEKTGWIFFE